MLWGQRPTLAITGAGASHTTELSRKVLSISKEANDIHLLVVSEVEPATREAPDSTDPQAGNPAELSCPRRPCTWHLPDVAKRRDRRIEESVAEMVPTPAPEVGDTTNEVCLCQRPQPNLGHGSCAKARSRSSATTSSVSSRASPDARPSAIIVRNRRDASASWSRRTSSRRYSLVLPYPPVSTLRSMYSRSDSGSAKLMVFLLMGDRLVRLSTVVNNLADLLCRRSARSMHRPDGRTGTQPAAATPWGACGAWSCGDAAGE